MVSPVKPPLSSAFLFFFVSLVVAAPWPQFSRHVTHGTRFVGSNSLKLDSYHPKSTFVSPRIHNLNSFNVSSDCATHSLATSAISFITSLGYYTKDVLYHSSVTRGFTKVAYLKQNINGVPVANAVASVAFHGCQVVSYSLSFVKAQRSRIAVAKPTVTWQSVLPQLEETMQGKYNGINVTLEYLAQDDGSIALTHVIQIQNETRGWYEAFVDAHSGRLLAVTDFVANASYNVIPITKKSIADGVQVVISPHGIGTPSSPSGWHTIGQGNTTTTSGNNVLSFRGQEALNQSTPVLNFNARYDPTLDPTVASNVDAARTNAFFIANVMHDFAYRYGFTEDAFNYQLDNFGKGGLEHDRILMSVQDVSGLNNANFATPPDGQPGICRMFIWNFATPARDGAMANDILVHELTHGITNRLTGGGTGRCLQTLEAGGLGEGWSDAMADWMSQTSSLTTDFVLGEYVTDSPGGLRTYPYSVNPSINPLTYQSLRTLNEIHGWPIVSRHTGYADVLTEAIGEVWANMLHTVYAVLVEEHGFSTRKLTDIDGSEGNIVFMHLFIDALSLQPCNPSFVQARDAWIQADENRYNGTNRCSLLKAFASRGLGMNADDDYIDDITFPADC